MQVKQNVTQTIQLSTKFTLFLTKTLYRNCSPTHTAMQDALRPSDATFKQVYERGYTTWASLSRGLTAATFKYPDFNLCDTFPGHPYLVPQVELDQRSSVLQANGTSTWETGERKEVGCGLPAFKMITCFRLSRFRPTVISMQNSNTDRLCNSLGDGGSHIPLLTLAWAYGLAARWVEILSGRTQYTDMEVQKLTDTNKQT